MKKLFVLVHDEARLRAMEAINAAPDGYMVRIGPPSRNLEQNALFHAICGELAAKLPYAGKARTLEQWKAIIVNGHSVTTKADAEIVPGLEGEFLNLRESSAKMTVARMSSLIEYALAFCAMHGIDVK